MHQFDSGRGLRMKNIFIKIVFAFFVIFLLDVDSVFAQDFTSQIAYSDYQYQLSIFQDDYSKFQEAKTFYLANPTLQLRDDARKKTLKMVRDRDNLMSVYLTALRMQIVDSTGFNNDQKGEIFSKIDSEVVWYKDHITKYLDSDELVDLLNKSDESKSRYATNTSLIISESLFDIGLSEEMGLRLDHQKIYQDLRDYIGTKVSDGKIKIDPFNRWFNDIDMVLQQLQKNEVAGIEKIRSLYTTSYGTSSTYDTATDILGSSLNLISQLNNYLIEMLASINNQIP
jgi:hypothetical protein